MYIFANLLYLGPFLVFLSIKCTIYFQGSGAGYVADIEALNELPTSLVRRLQTSLTSADVMRSVREYVYRSIFVNILNFL